MNAVLSPSRAAAVEKLWIPEPNSGCWLWAARQCRKGYGYVRINGAFHRAHRVMYETFVGPIPTGAVIRHKCDTRCCVNPDHLQSGTIAENNNDMRARGRQFMCSGGSRRGNKNPNAKLTEDQVRWIKCLPMRSPRGKICKQLGISIQSYNEIRSGKGWSHV